MKNALAVAAVVVAMGCGNSSGPRQSPWVGTWSVQPATVPGLGLRPTIGPSGSPFTATITDSSGQLRLQLPALRLDDTANADYVLYAAGQYVNAASGDSLRFTLYGTYQVNYQLPVNLTFAGVATGSSGVGTLTLLGSGVPYPGGAWTATKQ